MRLCIAIAVLLLVAGCPPAPSYQTDNGDMRLYFHELDGGDSAPLIAGGTACGCLDYQEYRSRGCYWADKTQCFDFSVNGATPLDAKRCLVGTVPGPTTWTFTPIPCSPDNIQFEPKADSVTVQVVNGNELTAQFDWWIERSLAEASRDTVQPVNADSFPEDWTTPNGGPVRFVAGSMVTLPITLRHPDHDVAAAFQPSELQVSVQGATAIEMPVDEDDPHENNHKFALALAAGAEATVHVALRDNVWPAGTVIGVPADEAVSLELVGAEERGLFSGAEDPPWLPLGVRAVVRDAAGRPLLGAPVEWERLRGEVELLEYGGVPGSDLPGAGYLMLRSVCDNDSDTPENRHVRVRGTFGELTDTIDFRYTVPANYRSRQAEEDCPPPGCGCSSSRGGTGAWTLLLAIALTRRRRLGSGAQRQG